MKNEELHTLINKYLAGEASPDEMKLVDEWYLTFDNTTGLMEQLNEKEKEQSVQAGFQSVKAALGLN